MSIGVVTLANSISGLSVTGVTIKDLDELIDSVQDRDCPILYPNPSGFMTGLEVERAAMASGASAVWNVFYTINYTYLHASVGSTRGLFDVYGDMVANVAAIADKILISDNLSGVQDIQLEDITAFGPVGDPAGSTFHGCEFSFRVTELE